jgi:plastocyanin
MNKLYFAVCLLVGTALLVSCGPPPPAEITIDMDEYSFTPADIELSVGQQVTLTLVNAGTLDHELMIGQGMVNDDQGRPSGFATDFFANAGVTPVISGGGMLMDHSEEHSMASMDSMEGSDEGDMGDMDHSEEEDMGDTDHAEEDDMADMSSEDMGGMLDVNMVMQPVGADPTTVSFTVTEDMLGIWEIGCFEQDGVHYSSGMKGTLTVRQ